MRDATLFSGLAGSIMTTASLNAYSGLPSFSGKLMRSLSWVCAIYARNSRNRCSMLLDAPSRSTR
ncbi:hypothetical protein D3C85_1760840 [compost metagenome]